MRHSLSSALTITSRCFMKAERAIPRQERSGRDFAYSSMVERIRWAVKGENCKSYLAGQADD